MTFPFAHYLPRSALPRLVYLYPLLWRQKTCGRQQAAGVGMPSHCTRHKLHHQICLASPELPGRIMAVSPGGGFQQHAGSAAYPHISALFRRAAWEITRQHWLRFTTYLPARCLQQHRRHYQSTCRQRRRKHMLCRALHWEEGPTYQ